MKFWMNLAFCEIEQCVEVACEAERLGFHGVTIPEHQCFPGQLRSRFPYPDAPPPALGDEWPDMWAMAGAIAGSTKRIEILSSVHILPLHHPISTARATATLARLCPGRFRFGVGTGWMREEYEAMGVEFGSRGRRMEEQVAILRRLWSGEFVAWDGEFYRFDAVAVRPAPEERVSIWFGGFSIPALRRAARMADGWIAGGEPVPAVMSALATLAGLRSACGRSHEDFAAVALHPVGLTGDLAEVRRLAECGLTGIVHIPFRFGLGADRSSIQDKLAYLRRFARDVIQPYGEEHGG